MSNHSETNNTDSVYYWLSFICGLLTAWVISGSVVWTIVGGLIGLLFAAFYLNALVKDRD